MRCPCCHGFMVVDHFTDMRLSRGALWLRAWRCMNCGEAAEPSLAGHHAVRRCGVDRLGRFADRITKRWPRPAEAVPLGV
ncbi:MAG: hypothetical protein EPO64_11495 [Nitrospirae bacterium]|nr:MAG: hypothetical protein EPO64_11495 [Nitrospirota bacterium]